MNELSIPQEVSAIARALEKEGHRTYLVGGCLRDLLLGRSPKDWDIATDAKPKVVQDIFPESVYENEFGTVGVKSGADDPALRIVEVTTFRIEGRYTDKRHPDEVKFALTIEEDLGRRDFTVNAMALEIKKGIAGSLVDPFGGGDDLEAQVIRTVGKPEDRFDEDALRLMRAVRFAGELNFQIDLNTRRAIEAKAGLLEAIAKERVRDEFIKILMTSRAAQSVILLEELDLLRYVLPELREGLGVEQNKHHIYSVFEHSVRALDYAAKQDYSLLIRLAALLHDIGKPRTKGGEGPESTFYSHETVGAKMAFRALDRLKFPKEFAEQAAHLIRYHMFYYNVGELTEAGVRRFLRRVGPEYVDDLLRIREADRIGSGVPKAVPYKLRHLQFMIEKVKQDPISPKMLKVNGEDVMALTDIPPSPKVGQLLAVLLEEVLDDPKKNERAYLEKRLKKLAALSEEELEELSRNARERKEEFEEGLEEEIKEKFKVS